MFRFMNYQVEYYKSKKMSSGNDVWYWRVRSKKNNKVVADSGEGYHNLLDCLDMIQKLWGRVMFWKSKRLD